MVPMMKKKLLSYIFLLGGVLITLPALAAEQEFRLKAAFLYKFCDYVNWPEGTFSKADSPIVVGISGTKYQISEIVSLVGSKYVHNRPFEIRGIKPGDSLQGIHVLYLTRDAKDDIDDFLSLDSKYPILTITDAEKSSELSIINFIIVNHHVRFEISQARADAVAIKLSSQLLSVAHKVYTAY